MSDFAAFNKAAEELFLSWHTAQLRKCLLDISNDEELLSYSVHYERVDKLVLWNSADKKMQMRLHVYSGHPNKHIHNQIDIAKAHNHRWNFSTRILAGSYLHTIYKTDEKYSLTPYYDSAGSCRQWLCITPFSISFHYLRAEHCKSHRA